jgi:chromosome partitioning protein
VIIGTVNQKGGVGKTVTGLNIAAVLSAVNAPNVINPVTDPADPTVLFIDTDKQGSALGVVQKAARNAAEAIEQAGRTARTPIMNGRNLADDKPIGLPFDFLHVTDPAEIRELPQLASRYRHTVIDSAGSFDDVSRSEAVIDVADYVLVPMLAEEMSQDPTKRSVDTMIRPRVGDRFGVVVVNYETRNGWNDLFETVAWVKGNGYPMLNTCIRSWRMIARNSICTVGRHTKAILECRADYQALATEITQGA